MDSYSECFNTMEGMHIVSSPELEGSCELLPSLGVCRLSSVRKYFNLLLENH